MTEEEYAKRKKYAGELKSSMSRRRVGHDYSSRRMYLITMTIEGRRPLLGHLTGKGDNPETADANVEPTVLGRRVQEEWFAVTAHHPEVTVVAFQLMPDHVHGILFVREAMRQHLGAIISGFKASTNKAYRQFVLGQETAATPQYSRQRGTAPSPVVPFAAPSPAARSLCSGAAAAKEGKHGLLWSPGYNDHILSNEGELDRWRRYLSDNPRRLYLRRRFPELFRVSFGLYIGPYSCSAVGNRFLLSYPRIKQVQCSTHFYESDILKAVGDYMAVARGGSVLVSPAISEGEKRTMRTAFDVGLPLILITANGLGSYSKPGGAFFDACAEGRLLILSPFEHQNSKVKLTRTMCMQMNVLAKLIAEGSGDTAHSQPPTPND